MDFISSQLSQQDPRFEKINMSHEKSIKKEALDMKTLHFSILLFAVLVVLGSSSGLAAAEATKSHEAEAIATEAYIYLYPLVLMDTTRKQMTNVEAPDGLSAPMNTFAHARTYPDPNFRSVVRPNFDTLYSSLWMDLTMEPMILSLPDSEGRYYLMPALDMWTDVNAVPGLRTTGTKAGNFVYVPPGWEGKLPKGVTRIDAPTPYMWIIGRTKTDGPKDYEAVHKFQDGLKFTPLSQWSKEWKPPASKLDGAVDMKTPPMKKVGNMSGKEFFEYAAELMKLHPPHITDYSQVWRLNRIGIVPGEDFDFDSQDPIVQQALNKAPAVGLKVINAIVPKIAKVVNGWQMNTDTMGVYGDYYLKRAAVANIGLGANQVEDAVYPLLITDADGNSDIGGKNYVLHFDKDELPPVDAFWSVTLYDKDGFPVANTLNRQNLSSWMPLKNNADGSLNLYFQADSPGTDKEANWLPAPKEGAWNLAMRLYAPKPSVLDGTWDPPALKQVQ